MWSRFALIPAALFGVGLLVAAASPAIAKDHGKHGKNGKGSQSHGRQVHHAHSRVPRVIAVGHRGSYRPYFTGRSYYAPHRHYHAAYRFPVYLNGAVVHRSYPYCGDHLFVSGVATLPQLAIGFSFGQPGAYVSGYYAAPAPPPAYYMYEEPPRYYGGHGHDHDHHHDCDHD